MNYTLWWYSDNRECLHNMLVLINTLEMLINMTMICTFYSFVVAHLVHNMLSHSQSLFLHLNHVILFIFWIVNLLQLNEMHKFYLRDLFVCRLHYPRLCITRVRHETYTSLVKRASSSLSSKKPSPLLSATQNKQRKSVSHFNHT